MQAKSNTLIIVFFTICLLSFQNCSSLQTILFFGSDDKVQEPEKQDSFNDLNEMMSYSEKQIKETRQKLENHTDLHSKTSRRSLATDAESKSFPDKKQNELAVEDLLHEQKKKKTIEGR